MGVKERITTSLMALDPVDLEVLDESERHLGHAGWKEGGETHFRVRITSPAFAGKSRLERHRMVNALVAREFDGRLHAFALEAKAPGE
jgi:BolA protein